MKKLCEKITDSELAVMQTLWAAGEPLPVSVLREELARERGWEASTVKTLLRRLCDKGAVRQEKREVFYYRPLVTEEQYHESAAESLLDRVFGGSAASLFASLVQSRRISDDDLDELRRFLEERSGRK